jgi:FKBP-type peptidyl-prolyl cis-trans isomerase FkpA
MHPSSTGSFVMTLIWIVRIASLVLFVAMVASQGSAADPGPVDKDAPKEFTATKSGLKYRILRKSNGPMPKASNTVKVNYKGWLDDGTEFDSSYKRGEPISFPLNGVIPGWTEGMQLVGAGGMIELEIPSQLGYGARGAGGAIPPNARLHFIVELLDVK